MNPNRLPSFTLLALQAAVLLSTSLIAAPPSPTEIFPVWPDQPPGVTPEGPEEKLEGRPRPFYQLTGIARPTVEVYAPEPGQANGGALLICPGGGLQRLAYEHEGLEVAQWAMAHGMTAFVLKYRVPAPVESGAADAQRALSLIRSRASTWEIDPHSVGIIGFSAGGEIAAHLATHAEQRFYETINTEDAQPCHADYIVMVYPGGLISRRQGGALKSALADRIDSSHPPTFLVHASRDRSENSLHYALALKQKGVPAEMHLYYEGGHGFGMRHSGAPLGTWPDALERWLHSLGHLDRPLVRRYAMEIIAKLPGSEALPTLPPTASLGDGLAVQRRLIASNGARVLGFKAGATSAAAQAALRIDGPLGAPLYANGQIEVKAQGFSVPMKDGMLLETEIGYRVAVDITYEVLTSEQARDSVAEILPVIEMPVNHAPRLGLEAMTAPQLVALNIGSDRFAFGAAKPIGAIPALDRLGARLTRSGEELHRGDVGGLKGGPWETLRALMNQITGQGHAIPAGSVILSGALGKPQPASAGDYAADYGELGTLTFTVVD